MLNFYVRHGMMVDKSHEVIPFKQRSGWKIIQVSIIRNELKLGMNSNKVSVKYSITLAMKKRWKM